MIESEGGKFEKDVSEPEKLENGTIRSCEKCDDVGQKGEEKRGTECARKGASSLLRN